VEAPQRKGQGAAASSARQQQRMPAAANACGKDPMESARLCVVGSLRCLIAFVRWIVALFDRFHAARIRRGVCSSTSGLFTGVGEEEWPVACRDLA
jgi:hypothetical protein